MARCKQLLERYAKVTENKHELLRDKDRLEGVDLHGKAVKFQVKENGRNLFIYNFGEVVGGKPLAQLGQGEHELWNADSDLELGKHIRKGTLKIANG